MNPARMVRVMMTAMLIATLSGWGCNRSKPEAPASPDPAAPLAPPSEIPVQRVAWRSDAIDPLAAFWRDVPDVQVPILPQAVTTPMNVEPAVSVLGVRAVHDGELLVIRLEWADDSPSYILQSDQFGDQVAIQLPLEAAAEQVPSPMMGHAGAPVRILQWRSTLQWELENGRPTVHDLYPNAVVDFYPDSLLAGQVAASYSPGRAVGNPVAQPRLLSPVVTQVAEGWGSLTDAAAQIGNGRGVWKDDRWQVTITQPLLQGDSAEKGLHAGMSTLIAFGVWDGGNEEVGGRKGWASWVPLRITP